MIWKLIPLDLVALVAIVVAADLYLGLGVLGAVESLLLDLLGIPDWSTGWL